MLSYSLSCTKILRIKKPKRCKKKKKNVFYETAQFVEIMKIEIH